MQNLTKVNPQHLRVPHEIRLRKVVGEISESHGLGELGSRYSATMERMFATHLQHSLCVTELPEVQELQRLIKSRLRLQDEVQVFVVNCPGAYAAVFARRMFNTSPRQHQAVVIVSQHFFNDLNQTEQLFVLGHELAHMAFKHYEVPTTLLLEDNDANLGQSRSEVSLYTVCCEVSCDLVGLVASGGDWESSAYTLAKFTSGLNDDALKKLGKENILRIYQSQYELLCGATHTVSDSTHPLTPIRIHFLKRFREHGLFDMLANLQQSDRPQLASVAKFANRLTSLSFEVLGDVYPTLKACEEWKFDSQASSLAWAIAIADGKLDVAEMQILKSMLDPRYFDKLARSFEESGGDRVNTLVDLIVESAKAKDLRKPDAIKILQRAAIIAQADGKIVATELSAMYRFAQHFGVSKHEVVTIAQNPCHE